MRFSTIRGVDAGAIGKLVLSLSLLLSLGCLSAYAQQRKWNVPTYEGLTLGKSGKADVLRKFGKPKLIVHPEDEYDNPVESLISYEYANVAGFDGHTTITMNVRTKIVIGVQLTPSENRSMPVSEVLEKYGRDYIERGIGLGPCPTAKEMRDYKPNAPYEYPAFLIYPQKGVVVMVSPDKNVKYIGYELRCT